jgi:hypothetical protein
MVASGTRKARATSAVDSPARYRRVIATRVSGASAGWQQVKNSRSRSSQMTSRPAGPALAAGATSARPASTDRMASLAA